MEHRLSTVAGVNPCPEWLNACRQYIRTTRTYNRSNNSNSATEEKVEDSDGDDDEVLHQILHSDLRHVIRCVGTSNGNGIVNDNEDGSTQPSKMLRFYLSQSNIITNTPSTTTNTTTSTSSTTLPASFRLMIQIEELLDVSLNAEDRLSYGPASTSSPKPIGNQAKRCLKMAISDGYYSDGSSYPPPQPVNGSNSNITKTHAVMIAMEVTPIPNLSVHSLAGIKVLLRGPIPIRFGVLMLDPGNTAVLGGCVPGLVQLQKKAMEMAAKVSGVGIDPTVRALIWNPHTGLEEDENEGEHESGDVAVSNVAATSVGTRPLLPHTTNTNSDSRQSTPPSHNVQDIENLTAVNPSDTSSRMIQSNHNTSENTTGGLGARQPRAVINRRPVSLSSSTDQKRDLETSPKTHTRVTVASESSNRSPSRRAITNNPYAKSYTANVKKTTSYYNQNIEQHDEPAAIRTIVNHGGTDSTTVHRPNSLAPQKITQKTSKSTSIDLTDPASKSSSTLAVVSQSKSRKHLPLGQQTLLSYTKFKKSSPREHSQEIPSASSEYPSHGQSYISSSSRISFDRAVPDNTTLTKNTTPETAANSNMSSSTSFMKASSSTPSSASPTSRPTPPTPTSTSTSISASKFIPRPALATSTHAFSEPLSFLELRTLLEHILYDADQYRQNRNKVFVVPSKMHRHQCNLGFNIVKSKNWKIKRKGGDSCKDKAEKYEYMMTCKMTGANEEDGVLTCKLSSGIIEPFMGVTPGNMRKLHRADKEKSNKVVSEGGHQILSELRNLAPCHMKLLYPMEEFQEIPKQIDGDKPVLLFCSRDG